MDVLKALLNAKNKYKHEYETLIKHPLVQSFLYLKWRAVLPFHYITLIVYAILIGLMIIATSIEFFNIDSSPEKPIKKTWEYDVGLFIINIMIILWPMQVNSFNG